MEMTEWIVNWILQNLLANPFTTAIYTAPRADQVSQFSRDRLRRQGILDSSTLRRKLAYLTKEEKEDIAIRRIPFINGSLCYLITAWGDFGAIRGIPTDFAAIDEIQDVQAEAIPVLEEALSHSKHRRMIMVGTPSDAGSQFDKLWQQSDMKEWDEQAQTWIQNKPENKFYSGYHFTQYMASWIINLPPEDPNSIEAKRQRYSERRFLNEVLGEFYRGLAKPLLPEDMRLCFEAGKQYSLQDKLDPPYVSYAGVDWGGGIFAFTVIWIMALDDQDRWRLLYLRKFDQRDPMKQVEIIGNLLDQFNVKQCVADIGYGTVQVSELQKKFGSRVYGCQYVRRPDIPLKKIEKDEYGDKISQMMVQADRSWWIEHGINLIKHKTTDGSTVPKLVLPYKEPLEVEWLTDHFTCLEMEEQETVSGKRYHHYTHPEGEPDDAYHGYIYSLIAEAIGRISPELSVMDLFE